MSDRVAVGGQPTTTDIDALRARGFTTVVNLRADGESDQPPSPEAERAAAEAAGLAYVRVPAALDRLDAAQVERVARAIEEAPGPVYVHCAAGQRACGLALLATGGDPRAEAATLGFPVVDDRLAAFVDGYAGGRRTPAG